MSDILNSDAFVFTRILRIKSKCNKTDATKKTLFRLLNAFFVADVISKFSKKKFFFRSLQHINEKSNIAVKFIDESFIKVDKFHENLNIFKRF